MGLASFMWRRVLLAEGEFVVVTCMMAIDQSRHELRITCWMINNQGGMESFV